MDAVLADPAARELVVVVDGDDPETVRVLETLATTRDRLRPLSIAHRGHLGALEEGVRAATEDVVVLLDDDVIPEPGTISGHAARHRGARHLVVVGPMPVALRDGSSPSVATRLYAAEYLQHAGQIERGEVGVLDALWAGNVSMRRDDCLRVGLPSAHFPVFYHSDRDLGYRLADGGLVGVFDPSLAAAHLHRRDDTEFLRDATRQGAGRATLHRVHANRIGPFRPAELLINLSAPLRLCVRLVGSTPAAEPASRLLMALGRRVGRRGRFDTPLEAAKLARRIMQWHGARRAVGGSTGGGAPAGTAARRGRR